MEESIQCYAKKIHRNFIKLLWDFFLFKSEIYFSGPEMSIEIHLPFSKKVSSKF